MTIQIKRTATPGAQPPALAEGQLAVGMADSPSPSLYVGVPTTIDPSGRRLINPPGGGAALNLPAATIAANNTAVTAPAAGLTGDLVERMLLYTQNSANAVQRYVDAKFNDIVSVKDFGAKGDGTAD